MPKYNVRILTPAWQDIERIADIHMSGSGAAFSGKYYR